MKLPWKLFLNVIISAGLSFMILALDAHATRGVRIQDAEGTEVGFYQTSYALLVGASAYHKGWPKLPGVLDDIKTVKQALVRRGFTVKVTLDPNHEELKGAFNEFINLYGQEPGNRLLFYFAGHGHTLRQAYGAEMGYIVPIDAPNPNIDKSGFRTKSLDMQQFEVYARRIQSKHALFLFDSCFSGSIFALSRAIPEHISYKTAKPVRQFITSGSADETVPDESIFRHQFLAALDGDADVNQDGYITATELGEFLFEKVVNYSRSTQHPQYGKIRNRFLDKGDFVFLSASSGAVVEKPVSPGTQAVLSVESNVAGARVLMDGRDVGPTNLSDTEILAGEHRIRVEKDGYEPYSKKIRFAKGRAVSLYVDLRQKNPPKGRLYADTEPENARIRILNIKPRFFQGMELEPGSYHVEVAAQGYETEKRWIELAAGDEEPLKFELDKIMAAERISPQKVVTNSIGMKFVLIPAGSFFMGSKLSPDEVAQKYGGEVNWYEDEHPRHEVRINEPFYLQTTEMTVGQWRKFIKETGYKTEAETGGGAYIWGGSEWKIKKGRYWANPGFSQDDRHPVTCVSWNDVREFIRWLNRKEGTDKYRLPTEAEWEYASRAGNVTPFSFGDDASILTDYAWHNENSDNRTHPVAQKKANKWGLYDMHGNVWEWVADDYHATYDNAPADGSARVEKKRGDSRVTRGGGWDDDAAYCRSAIRDDFEPEDRIISLGFRLARSVALTP